MGDNVRVAVRVRPFNQRERDRGAKSIIRMDKSSQSTFITHPETGVEKQFSFDFSYNSFVERDDAEYASQASVYDDLGAGILNNAFDGYNCSLFAYGQTGSGKSYSMVGYGADRGIVPIVCESLFARLAAQASDPDWSAKVTCSMLEIYMEKTRDLLNPSAGDLKVRNDVKKGFFVEGLTANAVADYASIAQLMDAGTKARTVASTAMNATSSRAHTIFQVVLTQTRVDRAAGTAKDKVAVINLIDLAGSERADSTGATGDRLKEGAAINLSLTCLGNCISALAANSDPALKKKARVPYRDSVLTMLLQNSLGGNAKTIMIAALSPADINYEETLSTLRYADRAKQIKNRAVVNEDPNEKLIRGLRDEIDALRRALASGGGSAAAAPDAASSSAAERARLRAEFDAEREAERARMREELETKLKLEFEESKPWEERLADAKERAGARERELREMGVLTGAARAAQLERARAVPHMTNLHEDAQLAEQALFFFEPGRVTTVGRKDAPTPPDVTLAGLPGTLPVHALIRCTTAAGGGGAAAAAAQPLLVTVEPAAPGAKVYVDGDLITAATPLHHLARLVFGASQAFKVVMPGDSAAQTTDADAAAPAVDYAFAMLEMSKGQAREFEEQERRRREESAEERRRADARVAELEARMRDERARGEAETAAKLRSMEEQVRASAGNEELLRKLKEEQERFAADAKLRQADLERKLLDQIAETERMRKKKEKDLRERSLLDEKLLKTIPLVSEAIAIAEELGKGMLFEPKLMANQLKRARATAAAGDDEAAAREQLDTEVYIRVEHIGDDGAGAGAAAASPAVFWHYDKFVNRLYLMREMYQAWVEHGRSLAGTAFAGDEGDPFVDPAGDVLIGTSTIYLDALYHCLAVNESTPIIDYKGAELGELLVRIVPHAADSTAAAAAAAAAGGGSGAPAADGAAAAIGVAAADDDLDAESLEELRGHRVGLSLCIDGARGLPPTFAGVHARYTFFLGAPERTPADAVAKLGCINPRIAFARVYTPVVSDELLKYVKAETLEVEVWGQPLAATTRPTSATSTPAASRRASDGGGEPAAPSTPTATQASISQTVAPAMPATPAPAQLASAEAVLAQPAAAGLTPLPPALALPTLAPTAASTGNAAAAAPVPASDASAAAAVTASGLQPPSAPLPTILPGVPTPAPAASSAKPRRSRFCAIA